MTIYDLKPAFQNLLRPVCIAQYACQRPTCWQREAATSWRLGPQMLPPLRGPAQPGMVYNWRRPRAIRAELVAT